MRVYVAAPEPPGQYPGILFYCDIFQLGRPITLLADRLAGYGYVVAAPEIFHRTEPIGTAIEPGDIGLMRGSNNVRRTAIAEYDADGLAVLEWLRDEDSVLSEKIGTIGFCIGGHLAFRAAFQSQVKAAVCCYPTEIHNDELGQGGANTIERVSEADLTGKDSVFLDLDSVFTSGVSSGCLSGSVFGFLIPEKLPRLIPPNLLSFISTTSHIHLLTIYKLLLQKILVHIQ